MKSKTKNILKWVPTAIVTALICMGAIMKLSLSPEMVEIYSRIGLLDYLQLLGLAELLLLALFLWKKTMRVGFLLFTGFYGGAMATEFSHGAVFIFPACILAVIWVAAGLRDRSIFFASSTLKPAKS